MTRSERVLLAAVFTLVFIGALLALTVIYRDELRQVIVRPLQEGWQDFRHAWLGLGEDFRWVGFIILLSVLLYISFPSMNGSRQKPIRSTAEGGSGRLAFWFIELKTLLEHDPINRLTVLELRRLALEVVGFRQQTSTVEAGAWLLERLEAGDEDVPPAIRLLVDPGALASPSHLAPAPLNPIPFIRWLIGLDKEAPAQAPLLTTSQLKAIIHYLEQVLEGSNVHDYS